MKYSVGLDLGGTKLGAALVDEKGKIMAFRKETILDLKRKNTPAEGQRKIVSLMADMVFEFQQKYPEFFLRNVFSGIGLASAGPLNAQTGCLINPMNFSGWKIVPIRKMLEQSLKRRGFSYPVFFQNDAIAAAFAEGWIGRAQGLKSYAAITIGTGIGTGVIFQGLPVQTHGMGSEFGHVIVESGLIQNPRDDLREWTVEGIASGTGILRRAQNLGFRGKEIEELVEAVQSGDHQYISLFDDAADALAVLCYNLSIGFNAEKILISGGLIKVRELYFERLKKRYNALVNAMNPAFKTNIQIAKCLNKAGVIGAAYLPIRAVRIQRKTA